MVQFYCAATRVQYRTIMSLHISALETKFIIIVVFLSL